MSTVMQMLKRRGALVVAVAVAATCTAACNVGGSGVTVDNAGCAEPGRVNNPVLVLMAQAVPTAQLVPCIASVPVGWSRSRLHVGNGSARFALGSDATSPREVTVTMNRTCRTEGATEVPSEVPGARRFERPRQVASGYAGDRYYVYAGGCTTYRFDIPSGVVRAGAISEASGALRFVSRAAVADFVRRVNDGRIPLDPPTRRMS